MDISFKTEQGRFNYRTAGVLIQDGKLLVMQDENSPYYYVPGGRVSFGEATEAALQREISEELGIDVVVQRLLWVVESFFEEDRTKELFHEGASAGKGLLKLLFNQLKLRPEVCLPQHFFYSCQTFSPFRQDKGNQGDFLFDLSP